MSDNPLHEASADSQLDEFASEAIEEHEFKRFSALRQSIVRFALSKPAGFLIGDIYQSFPNTDKKRVAGVLRDLIEIGAIVCVGKSTVEQFRANMGRYVYKHYECMSMADKAYNVHNRMASTWEKKELEKRKIEVKDWPRPALESRPELENAWMKVATPSSSSGYLSGDYAHA